MTWPVTLALPLVGLIVAAPLHAGGVDESRLAHLVRHECGSCHGLTLKGGLGPALLPAALRGRPVASVQAAILHGRPGTAMPGWSALLSAAEAAWIAERLISGFPDAP